MLSARHWTLQSISIVVHRPDEMPYGEMDEGYELVAGGLLRYSAYFFNMPIEMNHNDGVEWATGDHARPVFQAVDPIFDDWAGAGLVEVSDEAASPPCTGRCYHITLRDERGDSSFVVGPDSRSFEVLDTAFRNLIEAFERETGRPLTPSQLPQ